jgi:hypothetical protein
VYETKSHYADGYIIRVNMYVCVRASTNMGGGGNRFEEMGCVSA